MARVWMLIGSGQRPGRLRCPRRASACLLIDFAESELWGRELMSSDGHGYGPSYYCVTICQNGFGGCGERRHVPVHTQLSPSSRGVRTQRREVSGGLSRLGRLVELRGWALSC